MARYLQRWPAQRALVKFHTSTAGIIAVNLPFDKTRFCGVKPGTIRQLAVETGPTQDYPLLRGNGSSAASGAGPEPLPALLRDRRAPIGTHMAREATGYGQGCLLEVVRRKLEEVDSRVTDLQSQGRLGAPGGPPAGARERESSRPHDV